MRYQQEGEDEVVLTHSNGDPAEFSVCRGDGEVVMELFGGSYVGEYYALSIEEAENLGRSLMFMAKRVEEDSTVHFLRKLLDRIETERHS